MRVLRRLIVVGLLTTATCAYAGNGDLIVDGKLGVGTITPRNKIHILSPSPSLVSEYSDATGYAALSFMENGIYTSFVEQIGSAFYDSARRNNLELYNATPTGGITFHTNNLLIPRMVVTATGNVGIGTTNPAAYLAGTSGLAVYNTNYPAVSLGNATNYWLWYMRGNDLNLYESAMDRITFQSGGNVGIGTTSPSYTLHVNGSFGATSKSFDIPDPRYNDEKRRLVHASVEGPEVGVYYRGEVKLESGKALVKLPDYFEALARKENRTVLLTPKFENDDELLCTVAASGVNNSTFIIRAFGVADSSACNHKVYWEVKAERSDIERLKVELIREDEAGKSK